MTMRQTLTAPFLSTILNVNITTRWTLDVDLTSFLAPILMKIFLLTTTQNHTVQQNQKILVLYKQS